jgi:hypothetical protein
MRNTVKKVVVYFSLKRFTVLEFILYVVVSNIVL